MSFSVGVRDAIMIAHSFRGEEFGPAQALHGASYTVDAEFRATMLAPRANWVLDMDAASSALARVLAPLNYKNLDQVAAFDGQNTTSEFMAREIQQRLAREVGAYFRGVIKVTLHESHRAWASYEDEVMVVVPSSSSLSS